jgi:hypothetical protein
MYLTQSQLSDLVTEFAQKHPNFNKFYWDHILDNKSKDALGKDIINRVISNNVITSCELSKLLIENSNLNSLKKYINGYLSFGNKLDDSSYIDMSQQKSNNIRNRSINKRYDVHNSTNNEQFTSINERFKSFQKSFLCVNKEFEFFNEQNKIQKQQKSVYPIREKRNISRKRSGVNVLIIGSYGRIGQLIGYDKQLTKFKDFDKYTLPCLSNNNKYKYINLYDASCGNPKDLYKHIDLVDAILILFDSNDDTPRKTLKKYVNFLSKIEEIKFPPVVCLHNGLDDFISDITRINITKTSTKDTFISDLHKLISLC